MNQVAEHFERRAPQYAHHYSASRTGTNCYFRQRLRLACELARGTAGRLLDCACGTGEITRELLRSGSFHHATINDISPAMLQRARTLLTAEITTTELTFVQSDIFQVDPGGEPFDLIVCLGLIAHVGRLDALLRHLKSLLAPGGRILFQTTLADHVFTRIRRAMSAKRQLEQYGYRMWDYSHADIARACGRAGLRVVEMRRHTVGIPCGDRIWPQLNFFVEGWLETWAARHGVDAVLSIEAM